VVNFRKPTEADIAHVAQHMRKSDEIEVWLTAHVTPLEALQQTLEKSKLCSCVVINDEPVAILGLVEVSILPPVAAPWLLATDNALNHKRQFFELSPPIIEQMSELYPTLYNYVHTENRASVRWLKWLGFEFSPAEPYGPDGAPFYRFEMKRGH